jgi:hypothetical protein
MEDHWFSVAVVYIHCNNQDKLRYKYNGKKTHIQHCDNYAAML